MIAGATMILGAMIVETMGVRATIRAMIAAMIRLSEQNSCIAMVVGTNESVPVAVPIRSKL